MARIRINISTENFSRFARRAIAASKPTDSPYLLEGLMAGAAIYMKWSALRFDIASGAPGAIWAELAPETLRQRKYSTPGNTLILQKTGLLRSRFNTQLLGNFFALTDKGITFGIKDRTAKRHQDGTSRMPARPLLVAPPYETQRAMSRAFTGGFNRAMREAASGASAN